ncbi:MAG: SRPBCC family protein [Nitrospirota bacterium]|nr:SRPBCC family protein [Nitrospirota bacterium]
MPSISDKIVINAPPEKVFRFITNTDNWTEYVTSLTDITDLSSPGMEPGTTFRWEYRMLGVKLSGAGRVTENVPQKTFGMKMEGSFPLSEHYSMTPVDGGTEMSITLDYEIPNRVLERIANTKLVEKLNKREAENVLAKVKLLCEEM